MKIIEKIALEKVLQEINEIDKSITENRETPAREVQHVLPFMQKHVDAIYLIVNALITDK